MKTKALFTALLLSLALPAAADFVTVAPAYEVALSDFTAPATPNGGATFKRCDDCPAQTLRVTGATRYTVNGRSMSLERFRQAIATVQNRDAVTLTVKHDLAMDVIVSVKVTLRRQNNKR